MSDILTEIENCETEITLLLGVPVIFGYQENDINGNSTGVIKSGNISWTNANTLIGNVLSSNTGQSATYTPLIVGTDVLSFSINRGNISFLASKDINVIEPRQTVSVQIIQIPVSI